MSYSPSFGSGFADTQNRSRYTSSSGMCSLCTEGCATPCEIGLAAVLGAKTVYPTTTGANQIASEKVYPLDYSHFNINGRVFGAHGAEFSYESASIFGVKLGREYGMRNRVKLAIPIVMPALIKLNWRDYFSGAAMAGVTCMIGEDAKSRDANLKTENEKITDFPFMREVIECFTKYYRGYGQIVVQCNVEDDMQGVPEIALTKCGAKAIEFKFGQAAKGTQPAIRLPDLKTALEKKNRGVMVYPDPSDPAVQEAYEKRVCPNFYSYGRLPQWDEEFFEKRIAELRDLGMENVYFKMAGYDPCDVERVLRIASANDVDMVTFDSAGGGSGYSPCHMMNEWGLPPVELECVIAAVAEKLARSSMKLPAITLTGGFATEDAVFKALALGNGHITSIGMCRATMAAAMNAAQVGKLIEEGNVPAHLCKYGQSVPEIFQDLADLRALYGVEADAFPTGAIGVYSYLNKIAFGVRHFCALNRKFDVSLLDRSDVIPLTREAKELFR